MREITPYLLTVFTYFFNLINYVHSQGMTTLSPFEMPCLEQQGSMQNLDELKRLKKFFCISQCMGGFGGEVNFCKTDGICPAEAGAYMEAPADKAIIAQELPQTKGSTAAARATTTTKAVLKVTTKKPLFPPIKLG